MNQNYNFVQGLFSQVMNGKNEALATKKSTSFKGLLSMIVVAFFASISMQGQITYYSKASATSFSSTSSWGTSLDGTGAAPASISNANNFIISNGAVLTLDANASVRTLAISNGGSLTVSANTLTVSLSSGNTANLTINSGAYLTVNAGGTININGNFLQNSGGVFTQNGGNINVDGNSGVAVITMTTGSSSGTTITVASTAGLLVNSVVSVSAGTGAFPANTVVTNVISATQFKVNAIPTTVLSGATITANSSASASLVSLNGSPSTTFLNGGTFRIIDPHSSAGNSIAASMSPIVNASTNHTFAFGNGSSTDPASSTGGFIMSNSTLVFGNFLVDNNVTIANNRQIITAATTGILGNLTINANAECRIGSTTYVAGNITNNGALSSTATTFGLASFFNGIVQPSTQPQTISGTGVFRNSNTVGGSTANFTNIIFNNISSGGITFANTNTLLSTSGGAYNVSNTGTVSGTVTFTACPFGVDLGGGTFIQGVSTATPGSTSWTSGGFKNGTFKKWFGTATLTTTLPSTTVGNFPFVVNGANRNFQVGSSIATLTSGGTISVSYTSTAGLATVTGTDAAFSYNRLSNAYWSVSTGDGLATTGTFLVNGGMEGIANLTTLSTAVGEPRMVQSDIAGAGVHANPSGTATAPVGNRTGLSLSSATNFYMAINSANIAAAANTVYSVQNGNWNDATTWNTGAVPAATDTVTITVGTTVTVDTSVSATAGTSLAIVINGTLNVTANSLSTNSTTTGTGITMGSFGILNVSGGAVTVGATGTNRFYTLATGAAATSQFNVSGGTLTINGNLNVQSPAIFSQTGGTISVDGNAAGVSTSSVPSTAALVSLKSPNLNLTGGTFVIVDPHANTTASRAFEYSVTTNHYNAGIGHTMQFGDGTSTDAGGNVIGFAINSYVGTGRITFGNLSVVGSASGTNRVTSLQSYGIGVNGNFSTSGVTGEFNINAFQLYVAGNVTNNGILTAASAGILYFGNFLNNTASPSTNAQTLSGSGVFRNLATAATANFNSITINNNNPSGVTFSGSNWNSFTNATLSGTLIFTNGFLNVSGSANGLTLGISGAAPGALTYTAGGFTTGSTFRRWVGTTAITVPAVGGQFPFLNTNFQARHAFFGSATALGTAGWVAVKLNEVAGTTATTISDLYNVTSISNSNWEVTTGTLAVGAANDAQLRFRGDGIFTLASPTNFLAVGASAVAAGNTAAGSGSVTAPEANKTLLTTANLTQTFYVGTQNTIQSTGTGGAWGDTASWIGGVVPTCSDIVLISNGASVTITTETASNAGLTVNFGGTLTVSGGSLTVGCTNNNAPFINNGTLTVSGGAVNVNGNIQISDGSNFTHSGGTITIDGNNGGALANLNSVASGTPLFAIGTAGIAYSATGTTILSGGTIIVKDPHVGSATATSAYSVYGRLASGVNINAATAHTFQFGDGISIDGGSSTSGFVFDGYIGSGRLNFGALTVNSGIGNNRVVTQSVNTNVVNGNLTITSGILNIGALALQVGGNITVATDGHFITGTGSTSGIVHFGLTTGTILSAQTTAQSVSTSGNGTIRSNITTAAVTAGGTGYVVGDVLTLVGTGGVLAGSSSHAQFKVVAVNAGAVAAVVSINAPYYTTAPTAPSAITGGTGTGCTLTLTNPTINANFVNIVMNNTSASGVTLNALNNQSGAAGFTGASVLNSITFNGNTTTTGTNALLYGNAILRGTGSVTVTSGGMTPGSTYAIGTSAAQTGNVPTASTLPGVTAAGAFAYPFVDATGNPRYFFVARVSPTATGIVGIKYNDIAGITSGLSLQDTPSTYIVTDQYNSNWEVNLYGTTPSATSFAIAASATNAFGGQPATANARLMNNTGFVGNYQIGTTLPHAQRVGLTLAQLTASPFYMGLGAADIPFVSITNGNWETASTWNKNAVPTAADNATIANGTTVTVNSTAAVANSVVVNTTGTLTVSGSTLVTTTTLANSGTINVNGGALTSTTTTTNSGTINVSSGTLTSTTALTNNASSTITVSGTGTLTSAGNNTLTNSGTINANGGTINVSTTAGASTTGITNNSGATLSVAGGTVNVGPAGGGNRVFSNAGILTVSSGTLNINGNLSHSGTQFNQSGGSINLDPNAAGVTANSSTSSNYTLNLSSSSTGSLNWTGGTLTIVDPPATASTTHYSIYYNMNAHSEVISGHTLQFGDGISSEAGGTGGGFYIYNYVGSYKGNWNNIIVNGPGSGVPAATLNRVVKQTSYSNNIYGNLTINNNGEFDMSTFGVGVGNNLNVNTGGILTANGTLTFANPLGTGTVVNPNNAQSINGGGTIRNLSSSSTANLTSLTVNNSNATGVTLNTPLSVSGTLTMTSGIINTTATNLLTLGTATAGGTLSGTPSATNMIVGPFSRTFATRTAAGTYDNSTLFPVGKGTAYTPVFVDPTIAASSAATISGEAFATNSGSASPDVTNLSAARWELLTTNGFANLTNTNIRVSQSGIVSTQALTQAPTAAGVYDRVVGTTTYAPGPVLTATGISNAAFTAAGYFAYGNVAPPTPPSVSNYSTAFSAGPNPTLCANGGSVVTITGTNLATVNSVLFSGVGSSGPNLPGIITAKTATSVTVTAPSGLIVTGGSVVGYIQVTNPAGYVLHPYHFLTAGSPTVSLTSPATLTACAGAGSTLTATGATTYSWAPNTALSASTGASVIASPTANTIYTVTGTDINGCTDSKTVTISTIPSPSAITITPSSVCTGDVTTLVAAGGTVNANASTYSFAASAGTFTPLTGATSVPALADDDVISGAIPLGFSFTYAGNTYTNVYASSNGFLSFNASSGSGSSNSIDAPAATSRPLIAPLWDDLDGFFGTNSYLTTGTAGNRVFTFEWLNSLWTYSASNPSVSFQVKLYEANGKIEFVYRSETGSTSTSPTASAGLVGTTAGNYLSLSDLSAAATASSTVATNTIAVKPVTGQVFTFTRAIQPVLSWTSASSLFTDSALTTAYANEDIRTLYSRVSGAQSYTVTSTATNACTSSATVTVNPLPLPSAPIATNSTQCGARVPTASVASSAGSAGSGTFKWYDQASGGTLIQSSTSASLTTYSVATTSTLYVSEVGTNGCEGARTPVTVTVGAAPALTISAATSTICAGASTTTPVTITSTVADFDQYTWTPSTGVTGTSSTGYTFNPATTTAYVLSSLNTTTGCTNIANLAITVNPLPVINSVTTSSEPLCIGSSTTLTGLSLNLAPATATVGSAATTGSFYDAIFYHAWGGNKTQQLVTAAELIAAGFGPGNITNLGIVINSGGGTFAGVAISLAPTTNSSMSAGINSTATFTSVYSNASYTTSTGTNTFNFSTPFVWDGISNVIVQFCWSNNNFGGTSNNAKGGTTTFVSTAYFRDDALTPADICSGTTATGTTSFRPQFIFGGQIRNDISSNYNWSWAPTATLVPSTGNVVVATPAVNTVYTATATNPTTNCSATGTVSVSLLPLTATAPTATSSTHCGLQLSTATVTSTTATVNPVFVWYNVASGGTSVQSGPSRTFLTAINSTRTMYVTEVGPNGCESLRTPVVMTVNAPPVVTITSSVPTFCGTGGATTLTANSSDPGMTYTWTSFTGTTTTSALNTRVITATLSETSEFKVVGIATDTSCLPIEAEISVGVYPLPTATVTSSAQGVCPGTSATIGSGLSAGNFSATCIPAPSGGPATSPANAVALVGGGALQTPYPTGVTANSTSLDDNYWSGIPVGFNFNFFGNTVTNVFIGSNGTISLGSTGSTAFTFTDGFPSATSPASTIAVVARDLHWNRTGSGKISYWTEGIAPNRRFIVQFLNGTTYGTTGTPALPNGTQTAEAVFYETLGTIDIRVFEATFANAKYIGLQDGTQLIGATAPNCAATPATPNYWNGVTNEIAASAPQAWRFSPPANYTTTWYANGVAMPSVTADPSATPPVVGYANPGTNVFSIPVAPVTTTTYSITYTNLNSGCSNAPGSAEVVMAILGNTIPAGLNTIASSNTICLGQAVNFSTSYTGSTDGLVFQWQNSIDGGTTWNDIALATAMTLTHTPVVPTQYRCKLVACNGVPGYTSAASIVFNNSVLTSTPAVRCGVGTATLAATASTGATLNWYANASGGASLGTGTSFTTPTINTSTTYYVGAETISPQPVNFGSIATPSTALTTTSANGGMVFNTTIANVRINSADIFVSGTGDMVFNLQDASGVDIATTTLTGVVGSTTGLTTVNFPSTFVVPAIGTGYRIICSSRGAGLTWYYQTGAYPFNVEGASITGGYGWSSATTYATELRCIHKLNFTLPTVCSSSRTPVAVTVTPPPAITLSANPATICAESTTTPVTIVTGASDYSSYVWSPNTVTGNATSGWVFNPLTTTTYTLLASQTTGSTPCANIANVTVTVNPTPSVLTIAPTPVSACANITLPLVATGGTIAPVNAFSMDVIPTDFTLDSPTTSTVVSNTTYYSEGTGSILFNTGTSANASYSMNSNLSMTDATSATLTFSHIAAMEGTAFSYDYGYVEYSINGGTTWVTFTPSDYSGTADAAVFNANARFTTKSYADWITQFTSSTSNPGVGPATALWKTETFNIPATAMASSQFRVRFRYTTDGSTNYYGWLIDNVRVNKLTQAPIVWSPTTNLYSDAAATTPYTGQNLSTVYFKTSTAAAAVTYTATATSALGCPRVATVPVTVYQTAAPTGVQFYQFCPSGGATVSSMSPAMIGTNIKWYSFSTGGTALASTTPLTQGYYWASQTVNGCESPTRYVVFAISNATAAPSSSASQQFCNSATVASLTANGAQIKWYNVATGGTALASTAALSTGTYYATQTSGGCESPRTAVSVTVTAVSAPTGAATQSLSSLLTLGDIVVTGSNIVWYASAANAASGTNPLASTQLLANTTYYATQTINGCTSATSLAVTITTLANQDFDMTQFTFYPNPVIDLLNITYSQDMTSVKVFNMVGQQLMSKQVNSNTVQVDMSSFANGAYFIQVTTENAMKTVRVIKK